MCLTPSVLLYHICVDNSLVILCLLAVITSGLLLVFPTTRRCWNDLSMAFKTVPSGCLVAILIPGLLYYTPWLFFHTAIGGLLACLLGIGAACYAIYLLVKLLRRLFHVVQTYNSGAFVCLFLVLGMFLIPASCVLDAVRPPLPLEQTAFQKGPWITFRLPNEPDGTSIRFQQRSTHVFLAEYDYRFILKRGKTQKTYYLFPNCGGRTAINLYRLADGRLLCEDKDGRYLIDVNALTVSQLFSDFSGEIPGVFHAVIPENQPFNGFGSCSSATEDTSPTVEFFTETESTRRIPATRLQDELLESRQFYGCLAWGDREGHRPDGFSTATRSIPFAFERKNW